jgi:hypothetical protein
MGLASCLLAAAGAFGLARRSVGHGLGFVLAVGCIYGWLRANFLDGLTHFCFDAALLGLYAAILPRIRWRHVKSQLLTWTGILIGWPLMIVLLSPFLDAQHPLIEIVGLRTAILFVPLVIVGALLQARDIQLLSGWAEWCIVGAAGFTFGEYFLGLEKFFPINDVTTTLYGSKDIAGGYYRLPSSFTSAHAYGLTMVALLPLLFGKLDDKPRRAWFTIAASALASLGVFACGARLPVALFALVVGGLLLHARRSRVFTVFVITTAAVVGYLVSQDARLQRFETLSDTEMVQERLAGSVNMTFLDILSDYPMGRGLGSAIGTSIPFFLSEYARPQVGIESEFGRLLLEEGLPGLLMWLLFVGAVLGSSAPGLKRRGSRAITSWLFCLGIWTAGLIGAGALAAIPTTMLLMLYFGSLSRLARKVALAPQEAVDTIRGSALLLDRATIQSRRGSSALRR